MSEKGGKRGAGTPFYVPSRRKTSAEIISEARAAVYGEMTSGSSGSGGVGGILRPLRTRRPFTPREPQRTLFTERRKTDLRPPSAFDLKNLTLLESKEDVTIAMDAPIDTLANDQLNALLLAETRNNTRRKSTLRNQPKSVQEHCGDGWNTTTKLPHLSGHTKPLHRRGASHSFNEENKMEVNLSQAISITRPLAEYDRTTRISVAENNLRKSLSPDTGVKRKQFAHTKSSSCDTGTDNVLGNIGVKHLAVQIPNALSEQYESMTVLELAEVLSNRTHDAHRTTLLLELLQKILEKNIPVKSLRDLVLRSLYMHIDSDDERVLVAVARAMLSMRVTGTHLASACKLVFKIARNDKNDIYFRSTNLLELLVEGCGRADPVTEGECCVYGAGALRFLALEPRLCSLAHRAGALHLAVLHLKILNAAKAENPRSVSEQSTHALYQLTGVLRNLASGEDRDVREFATSGALTELIAALALHTDRDVITNVARCLSVVSCEESCCSWLCASHDGCRAMLRALAACASRAPLAVRLSYTLGNMAAAHEQARIHIYKEESGIDVLLTILELYTKRNDRDHNNRELDCDPDLHLVGSDLCGSDASIEDVLIKTVRVVANLCLTESIGRGLVETHSDRIVNALLACLQLSEKQPDKELEKDQREKCSLRRNELATAALATLNNVTFYREPPDPPDMLDAMLDNICKVTCRWISIGSGIDSSASCEAVRALGNLSRATHAAQLIVLEGVLDALPSYLQHEDVSVRCAAAGVLVNVCAAGPESSRAGSLCASALRSTVNDGDAPVAALLARALWNAHAHAPLPAQCAHQAAIALTAFIDDDSVFTACESLRMNDRRASDPSLYKHHVKFELSNNNYAEDSKGYYECKTFSRALSVDQDLHLDETGECSGEDLGFEEGDLEREECDCNPCKRLVAWEELVGVAIPLLEKLKPVKTDASVGTD